MRSASADFTEFAVDDFVEVLGEGVESFQLGKSDRVVFLERQTGNSNFLVDLVCQLNIFVQLVSQLWVECPDHDLSADELGQNFMYLGIVFIDHFLGHVSMTGLPGQPAHRMGCRAEVGCHRLEASSELPEHGALPGPPELFTLELPLGSLSQVGGHDADESANSGSKQRVRFLWNARPVHFFPPPGDARLINTMSLAQTAVAVAGPIEHQAPPRRSTSIRT